MKKGSQEQLKRKRLNAKRLRTKKHPRFRPKKLSDYDDECIELERDAAADLQREDDNHARATTGCVPQSDPLRGKIREPLPDDVIRRMNEWFLLGRTHGNIKTPTVIDSSMEGHYNR